PQRNQRLIVGERSRPAELVNIGEDRLHQFLRWQLAGFLQAADQPIASEIFVAISKLVFDSVGIQQDQVLRLRLKANFVVIAIVQQAERNAFENRIDDLAAAPDRWRQGAGVRHGQHPAPAFPMHQQQHNVLRVDFPFEQCLVKQLHQLSRAAAARRQNAQQAGNQGSVESGSGAFSADIAESNQRVLLSMLEEIVKIAADFAGRTGFQAYLEPPNVWRDSRSQNILKFARRLQIVLHAVFALRHLFVKTSVLNRTRNLRGQQGQRAHVVFREESELCA